MRGRASWSWQARRWRPPAAAGRAAAASDEANQAVKAGALLETGVYRYDPDEHHGPTLYWLTLPALWLSGAERPGRQPDALAYRDRAGHVRGGPGALLLLVADGLGGPAVLLAAVLTAISPAMVFYSRYYIQEMLLVFFTVGDDRLRLAVLSAGRRTAGPSRPACWSA